MPHEQARAAVAPALQQVEACDVERDARERLVVECAEQIFPVFFESHHVVSLVKAHFDANRAGDVLSEKIDARDPLVEQRVEPVIAAAFAPHLVEPGPDSFRRSVDVDGMGHLEVGLGDDLVTWQPALGLAEARSPFFHLRAQKQVIGCSSNQKGKG